MYLSRSRAFFVTILLSVLTGSLSSAPSSLTGNLFLLQGENVQSLPINQTFSEDSKTDLVMGNTIACAQQSAIYGASVDAKIKLLGEASLVRVILIDQEGNEFMIYEINSLLAENTSFSIADACHETKLLDAVNPASIRVDVLAATVTLQNASFVTDAPCARSEMSTLQEQIKRDQHQQRIDLYNKMIKAKGEEWIAGPTAISAKTYEEKKCYYLGGANNPLPNTQGTEFYAGGVMPGRTNTPPANIIIPKESMYVDTFDWRNRHGATESSSPYYNDTQQYGYIDGWCSKIKNQGSCGSCYIFASVGEAETKYHLYYNQHLGIDLSEQFIGSCHERYAGAMCNGGMPDRVSDFMVTDGITDEDGFEYTASNSTPCRDSASNPEEHGFFAKYKKLKNNEVNDWEDLKKAIIKYGPNAGADLSISHAMTVVGYQYSNDEMTLIYKNSWGGSGDKGYMYKKSPWSNSSWAVFDMTEPEAIESYIYSDDDIRCVDEDGDGFYNWGIGPKPATCPDGCPDEIDCDDSDPEYGPYIDSTGECEEQMSPYISISAPNGGEVVEKGCLYTIVWRDNITGEVKIELLKGGTVASTIASSTPSTGSYEWDIPENTATGTDYQIKVTSIDSSALFNQSAQNFSIVPEYIITDYVYFENFDTLEKESETLPFKYEQLTDDDLNWLVWEGPTPSRIGDPPDVTGPMEDHTPGTGGNYLYTEASASNNGNPDKKFTYVTPKFDLTVLTNPRLSFWYHMFSDNAGEDHMGELIVDISVNGVWNEEVIKLSGNKGDNWIEETLDLNPYQGKRVIFRFSGITGDSWESDICIDDIEVDGQVIIITSTVANSDSRLWIADMRLHYQLQGFDRALPVTISLYNIQGKLIKTLVNEPKTAGRYTVRLSDKKHTLASGLYFVKVKVGDLMKTVKILKK